MFPEHQDLIHKLRHDDPHFAKIFESHQELDKEIIQLELNPVNLINDDISVYADRDMIELVLRNLIANAIKFSNDGSTVSVSAKQKDDWVEVCVADSGQGITPENLKKLFGKELFTTVGTRKEKGSGLVLVLFKDFITLNSEKIWASSTLGKGSKFFFTLPIKGPGF